MFDFFKKTLPILTILPDIDRNSRCCYEVLIYVKNTLEKGFAEIIAGPLRMN